MVEGVGLEPTNPMGADLQSAAFGQLRYPSMLYMPTSIKWCRPEDLNPQPTDYKSVALPVELGRLKKWWLGTESNRRHTDFQSVALPTELPSRILCIA